MTPQRYVLIVIITIHVPSSSELNIKSVILYIITIHFFSKKDKNFKIKQENLRKNMEFLITAILSTIYAKKLTNYLQYHFVWKAANNRFGQQFNHFGKLQFVFGLISYEWFQNKMEKKTKKHGKGLRVETTGYMHLHDQGPYM